ncbi:DUF6089 family protein [Roseivirga sp. BDSF3-8]|uniref:DUF6089 family protein n=1 Tax=Roseivirga sp. BDSF3-8 TaxID=3241598 RepID=UPI003531A94A
MINRLFLIALFLITLGVSTADAQYYRRIRNQRLTFLFGGGLSTYYGELQNDGVILKTDWNAGIGFQYALRDRWALRSDISVYHISGNDANAKGEFEQSRKKRNLSFEATNFEWNVVGVFHWYSLDATSFYRRPIANPYLFAGIGATTNNPTANLNGESYDLRPIQTEGEEYASIIPVLPFGGGVKLRISNFLNFNAEVGYRVVFSDYLDDVSDTYIPQSAFANEAERTLADRRQELGFDPVPAGTLRGNPDKNDGYLLLKFSLEYYLTPGLVRNNPYRARRSPYRR